MPDPMMRAMPEAVLPRLVDLRKLVGRQGQMTGQVPLSELSRLDGLITGTAGEAVVELAGTQDEDGHRIVRGHVAAQLPLQCQRCLQSVSVAIDEEFCWALVWGDSETQALPKRYDPLVIGEDAIDCWDLVAEELLLALPIVARHPEGECKAADGSEEPAPLVTPETNENPFDVLKTLKKN